MSQIALSKIKILRPFLALVIILLVCAALWVNLPNKHYTQLYSNNGIWDLREFNFENSVASIHGRIDIIPVGFLSPEEFVNREGEISRSYPKASVEPATVRIKILVPDSYYYIITRVSYGYADRIYVNGDWLRDVGNIEDKASKASVHLIAFLAQPVDGVIEIINGQSNFVYQVHGVYQGEFESFDESAKINEIQHTEYVINIIIGILLILVLVSLLLYLLLYNYRPAVFFVLLALVWLLFTGSLGSMLFIPLAPWLTDPLRFRLTTVVIGVASTGLMFSIAYAMIPGLYNKYFARIAILIFLAWTVFFMFASIGATQGIALWMSRVMTGAGIAYSTFASIRSMRYPNTIKIIFFVGAIAKGYAAIRDVLHYYDISLFGFNILLPPFGGNNFVLIAAIIFLLCLISAIFMAAMQEKDAAKEIERRLTTENATLESLARMKTEYLTNLSHEIKTPLTIISVYVQKAIQRYKKSGEKDEAITDSLKRAQDVIMRVARMTETTLKMSSLQEARGGMIPLDIADILKTSTEANRSFIEKQGNDLKINIEENLPSILGKADEIVQVMLNILTNANKHTKNGIITVNAKLSLGFVNITVSDTGGGISPELLPYVFERGISDSNGTGFGLFICKNIIESHDGIIKIKSELGIGTTVIFTLPIYNGKEGAIENNV